MFDNQDSEAKTIYAAGVTGGIWKSDNLGISWFKINSASYNLNVSCMKQDANGTIYAGTGESFDAGAFSGLGEMGLTGGFMGQGNTPNFEILVSAKPDVILMWTRIRGYEKILAKLEKLGIPVLLVNNESIYDLISQFELYAKLTGDEARAKELIAYTKKSLSLVEQMQDELAKQKQVRYYFAQGVDGQYSECEGSFHIEPFKYAGAKNALDCKMSSNYGMEKIALETILLSDPDVIVALESSFVNTIYDNPQWATLRAVKGKKVFLIPSSPFNYISRPPSFMRLLGIRWLIDSFYPSLLKKPFAQEKEEFEKLFFIQRKGAKRVN